MRHPAWLAALFVLVLALCSGCRSGRGELRSLRGSVTYRERMALVSGTVIRVQFVDTSRSDAPPVVIAQTEILDHGQVPIPFEIRFPAGAIVPKGSYGLSAQIMLGTETLWHTPTPLAVLEAGLPAQPEVCLTRGGV